MSAKLAETEAARAALDEKLLEERKLPEAALLAFRRHLIELFREQLERVTKVISEAREQVNKAHNRARIVCSERLAKQRRRAERAFTEQEYVYSSLQDGSFERDLNEVFSRLQNVCCLKV